MDRRKKCSNSARVPANQKETNVYTCFKRGVAVGMKLAQRPPLDTMNLRQLADMGRQYKVPYYSRMNKDQLIEALRERRYPRDPPEA